MVGLPDSTNDFDRTGFAVREQVFFFFLSFHFVKNVDGRYRRFYLLLDPNFFFFFFSGQRRYLRHIISTYPPKNVSQKKNFVSPCQIEFRFLSFFFFILKRWSFGRVSTQAFSTPHGFFLITKAVVS